MLSIDSVVLDFCMVVYKMPCQALLAHGADMTENSRVFKASGVKGSDPLPTLYQWI